MRVGDKWKKWDMRSYIKRYLTVEYLVVGLIGIIASLLLGYLCYDSLLGGIVLLPIAIIGIRFYEIEKCTKYKKEMLIEFKDFMNALVANMRVGLSIENAWIQAYKDLQMLYIDASYFQEQLEEVISKIKMNISIEVAVVEMAKNCNQGEIYSFAELLSTAKKNGGELAEMMDRASSLISEKIDTEQEIQTILSGKKLEHRIMCGMPVFMLIYLRFTNEQYIASIYHNFAGIMVMSVCIVGTIFAILCGKHLIKIEV